MCDAPGELCPRGRLSPVLRAAAAAEAQSCAAQRASARSASCASKSPRTAAAVADTAAVEAAARARAAVAGEAGPATARATVAGRDTGEAGETHWADAAREVVRGRAAGEPFAAWEAEARRKRTRSSALRTGTVAGQVREGAVELAHPELDGTARVIVEGIRVGTRPGRRSLVSVPFHAAQTMGRMEEHAASNEAAYVWRPPGRGAHC